MAILTDAQRQQVWAKFMQIASADRDELPLLKSELLDGVDAIDQWINDNAGSLNTAIPQPARGALTTAMKAKIFFFIANKRFEVV